jgi:hypothetical protein
VQTAEAIRELVRKEKQLIERLRTANIRFADAQLERMWAIQSAHDAGLSIRQIAVASGLSSTRVHQLLNTKERAMIPIWATKLGTMSEPQSRLAAEVKLLRQCSQWLIQFENGEEVVVNLRPDADAETEYVRFDRLRVIRILERIAADLDQLAEGTSTQFDCDSHSERKRRLAEEPKSKRRLSTREEQNALRTELKLPPT